MKRSIFISTLLVLLGTYSSTLFAPMAHAQERRALIVGINTYLPEDPSAVKNPRRLRNLTGATHDAEAIEKVLRDAYGFQVETLLNRDATRDAILKGIDRLVDATDKGHEVVFYFAGHGSQIRNSKSPEKDGRDETLVPADALRGVPDIRDKELRRQFNRVIERQGRLTIILDSCHSGSAVRGLPGYRESRFVEPMAGDSVDGADAGPPLERAALILAASEKDEAAFSLTTSEGKTHGLFTYSLLKALGYAGSRESAGHVFLRARGRLRAEGYDQNPVIRGPEARFGEALLGGRSGSTPYAAATVLAVEDDGSVRLGGGWATGLSQGSLLRLVDDQGEKTPFRVRLVEADLTRSLGEPFGKAPQGIRPELNDLFVLEEWAVPELANLRVYIAETARTGEELRAIARKVAIAASELGVEWIEDPVVEAPSHVLLWREGHWHLVSYRASGDDQRVDLGADLNVASLRQELRSADGAKLFLQLPAPAELRRKIRLGRGTPHDGIEVVDDPAAAIYVLAGRWHEDALHYAWVRPDVVAADDTPVSSLPLLTKWNVLDNSVAATVSTALDLQDLAVRLGKIRAWLTLESPDAGAWSYRLALRNSEGAVRRGVGSVGTLQQGAKRNHQLAVGEEVGVILELPEEGLGKAIPRRWVYVFFIDSHGNSKLIFPVSLEGLDCNIENRLPLEPGYPPSVMPVGCQPAVLGIGDPSGIDTYFLLTTSEPLVDPYVLNFEGVKGPKPRANPLENLLRNRGVTTRSGPHLVPTEWSIQRVTFETVLER